VKRIKSFQMTMEEYQEGCDEYQGYCIYCGEDHYEIEPDAREYVCEECGAEGVYGLEELMIMGMIDIIGDDE
jgi:hypothetical protein